MSDRRVFLIEVPDEPGPVVAATIFTGADKAEVQRVFWNAYLTWVNAHKERDDVDS